MKLLKLPNALTVCITIWTIFVVCLVAATTIVFVGTWREHEGNLAPQILNTTNFGKEGFCYSARIRGIFFRGNDLFRVRNATIVLPPGKIISQEWDVYRGKGQVLFSTNERLPTESNIPIKFELTPRWSKIVPGAIRTLLFFLAIQICLSYRTFFSLMRLRPISTIAVPAFITILVCGVVCIVARPGWIYGDSYFILSSTVQGDASLLAYFPEIGRFFPLAFADLNLLIPFGNSPLSYHVERAILFALTVSLVFVTARKLTDSSTAFLIVLVFLTTPSLFRVYAESIFAEAVVACLLATFFCFYLIAARTGNIASLFVCAFAAIYASYCKEPIFGLFAVFAAMQLIFGYASMTSRIRILNCFLIVNGMIFVGAYFYFCGGAENNYAESQSARLGEDRISALQTLFSAHVMMPLAIVIAVARFPYLFSFRANRWINYDAALYSGLAYVVALGLLKLSAEYLAIPAYVAWMTAIAGYVKGLPHYCNAKVPTADKDQNRVEGYVSSHSLSWTPQLMALLTAIFTFQFLTPITEIHAYQKDRLETQVLTEMFAGLNDEGYALFVICSSDANHQTELSIWRRDVLNVFHSNFCNVEIDQKQPFQLVAVGDPKLLADCCVAIFDTNQPGAEQVEAYLNANGFRPVNEAPYCMGAHVYAKHSRLENVNSLLSVALEKSDSKLR